MKYCTNCGIKNRDEAKFCTACGTKMTIPLPPNSPDRPPEPVLSSSNEGKMNCIITTCFHCNQHLEIPLELLGMVVNCPTCNTRIQLPPSNPTSHPPPLAPEDAELFLGLKSPSEGDDLSPADPPAEDSPYYGYGGWLAFFCAVQIFIGPLVAIASLMVSVSSIGKVADRYPGLVFITILESIGDLGIIAFGVYAGIMLRGLRPGAVRTAKRFLLSALVWSFLCFALPYLGGRLPSSLIDAMLAEAGKGALRTVIVFAIWYSYFSVSKRVKATFPND